MAVTLYGETRCADEWLDWGMSRHCYRWDRTAAVGRKPNDGYPGDPTADRVPQSVATDRDLATRYAAVAVPRAERSAWVQLSCIEGKRAECLDLSPVMAQAVCDAGDDHPWCRTAAAASGSWQHCADGNVEHRHHDAVAAGPKADAARSAVDTRHRLYTNFTHTLHHARYMYMYPYIT